MEFINKIKLSFNKLFNFLKPKEEIQEPDVQLDINAELDNNTHTIDFSKSASLDNSGRNGICIQIPCNTSVSRWKWSSW